MKKVRLLLSLLSIGGMILTGCEKQETNPTSDPTPATVSVVYKVDNTNGNLVLSDCFKLNVTYTDANGQLVNENGVVIPWTKTIEVKAPFHAKMQGEIVYNEAELPDPVVFGKRYGIGRYSNGSLSISMNGNFSSGSRDNFLQLMATHPDRLQFTAENDI